MRRLLFVLLAALFGLVLAAQSALADSPHFLFANASVSSSTGQLQVSFKEAGLGTTVSTEKITLSVATATATYQCFNNGGNHPKAGNKETVSTSLTVSGTFPVRNGQTTGTIFAGPPGTNGFTCPPGQNLFLVAVSYSGLLLTGQNGDTAHPTPDPASLSGIMIKIS